MSVQQKPFQLSCTALKWPLECFY